MILSVAQAAQTEFGLQLFQNHEFLVESASRIYFRSP